MAADPTFRGMGVLRKHSPPLSKTQISVQGPDGHSGLERAKTAVSKLIELFGDGADPSCVFERMRRVLGRLRPIAILNCYERRLVACPKQPSILHTILFH